MKRRRGLTLIELVVAITVAGVAVSAGYAALGAAIDRRETADAAMRATMREWAIRDAIAGWLAGARLDVAGAAASFRGLDGERDRLADDEITFLTTSPTPLGDGDAIVRLSVARDKAGRPLGLSAEFSEWRGRRAMTVILDSTVASLDIAFRSGVFTNAAWSQSWVSSTVLPSGVRLALTPARGQALAPLLREEIVVALEGGR